MSFTQFTDDGFRSAVTAVVEAADRGAADVGEVLATAGRIEDGDADSWVLEWLATAGEVWAQAHRAERAGRRETALACFRRAGSYYASALRLISRSAEDDRRVGVWRRQRACWDRVVDLMPVPGERIAIPYGDMTLPGYFFASAPRGCRPLVIINGGSDCTSQMWVHGGAAAAERGYHWMTFDGPGQQAALIKQGLRARPDWEAVLTPVIDAVRARPDVDGDRIAVIGVGQGGFLVARALAFEQRVSVAVADPGIVDMSASFSSLLDPSLRELLDSTDDVALQRELHLALLFSPALAAIWKDRAAPYAGAESSPARVFRSAREFRLGPELGDLVTPMLVIEAPPTGGWAGQSEELFDRLSGPKALVRRAASPILRETAIFDWIDSWLVPA